MTITLPPEIERRLNGEASRLGVDAADYAKKLIVNALSQSPVHELALDALSKWEALNETDDPEEIARRQQEFEEFKEGMNRNRLEAGGPGAGKVYP